MASLLLVDLNVDGKPSSSNLLHNNLDGPRNMRGPILFCNVLTYLLLVMAGEVVRYKPGEAIRWLETGSEKIRKGAMQKAQSVIRREGARSLGRDVRDVAGALFGAGSAAMADLAHRQASASEYVLDDNAFDVVKPTGSKRILYSEVKSIRMEGDKALLELAYGSTTIKPFAHLVSGRVRVPVGWTRNNIEVPYELLIDELAARCNVEVDFE